MNRCARGPLWRVGLGLLCNGPLQSQMLNRWNGHVLVVDIRIRLVGLCRRALRLTASAPKKRGARQHRGHSKTNHFVTVAHRSETRQDGGLVASCSTDLRARALQSRRTVARIGCGTWGDRRSPERGVELCVIRARSAGDMRAAGAGFPPWWTTGARVYSITSTISARTACCATLSSQSR